MCKQVTRCFVYWTFTCMSRNSGKAMASSCWILFSRLVPNNCATNNYYHNLLQLYRKSVCSLSTWPSADPHKSVFPSSVDTTTFLKPSHNPSASSSLRDFLMESLQVTNEWLAFIYSFIIFVTSNKTDENVKKNQSSKLHHTHDNNYTPHHGR